MPIKYLRKWNDKQEQSANWRLACFLEIVAGATVAAGFAAATQYAWPMTKTLFGLPNNSRLEYLLLVIVAVAVLVCFILGSAAASVFPNWEGRKESGRRYGFWGMAQAFLLIGCGFLGMNLGNHERLGLATGAILFSFLLGLQNAIIRSLLNMEHETSHVGGILTELGIGLGDLIYAPTIGLPSDETSKAADPKRLALLTSMVGFFFVGVLIGTLGFNQFGFLFFLFFAATLLLISALPFIKNRAPS